MATIVAYLKRHTHIRSSLLPFHEQCANRFALVVTILIDLGPLLDLHLGVSVHGQRIKVVLFMYPPIIIHIQY